MGKTAKKMRLETSVNERGFDYISFQDDYQFDCSLQKSSLATEDAIWLGKKTDRMHLTQKQVKVLLPFLKRFVKTGYLLKRKVSVTLTAEDNLDEGTASALVTMIEAAQKFLKTTNQNQNEENQKR